MSAHLVLTHKRLGSPALLLLQGYLALALAGSLLLLFLLRHAEKVVTHRQILSAVWGPAHVEHHEYVRVHMSQLRQKLEAQPAHPRILLTEPGIGYRLVVP